MSIVLCQDVDGSEACEGRGAATRAEKDAVMAALRAVDGIEKIYFEDVAHARQVMSHAWGHGRDEEFRTAPRSESFHVKLVDPARKQAVADAVEGLPGVGAVQ
ncbi:hypothetical protein GCM10010156_66740 [Planobispora rosea]|uniref:FtsX extracellular domain-containing protein n=1 Tax=Planobispora rosea TaxID=35762 RepID=A0A8J3WHP0_PLARO|nr:hypothetical protein GCM10010156_66740 [Planobispora rosea]GIH88036.1 hypothetical protein Pro02_64440 [Planobispora rosea]